MIRRIIISVAVVVGVALTSWVMPLFHVVPIDEVRKGKGHSSFKASSFAAAFWEEQLTGALPSAVDAAKVLEAIATDFQTARERYGRTVGISNSYYVFVHGTGRIVSADSKVVGVAFGKDTTGADVVLPVGMIFGNTVRDATGLLDTNRFPNSQDFNDVAAELNRIVESRVLPTLRDGARVGRGVRFVGCAVVSRDEKQRKPLKVIPLRVEFAELGQPD